MNAVTKLPAQELAASRLRSLLSYDAESGAFRWLESRGRTAKAGQIAGTRIQGRICIKIDGRPYYAHRLAFLYVTGSWPTEEVDHIDGNSANNAWLNLRRCSRAHNMQNKKVSKRNKAGLLGVSKHGDAWQSTIRMGGKHYHLGRFGSPADAHEAYIRAKREIHLFNPSIDPERASK